MRHNPAALKGSCLSENAAKIAEKPDFFGFFEIFLQKPPFFLAFSPKTAYF